MSQILLSDNSETTDKIKRTFMNLGIKISVEIKDDALC